MSFFASFKFRFRVPFLLVFTLLLSAVALAQVALKYRLLTGYQLREDAPVSQEKTTFFTFEDVTDFREVVESGQAGKQPDAPNFTKETAIGIVLPPTSTPPKLSVSRVFVQDSVLTVRYIRLKDTTLINNPQSFKSQPMLLLAIPKQTVLKTRFIQNGKVVKTIMTPKSQ